MFYQPYTPKVIAREEFPLSKSEMRAIPRPPSLNSKRIDLVWQAIENKFYLKLQSYLESKMGLKLEGKTAVIDLIESDRIIKVLRKDKITLDWWEIKKDYCHYLFTSSKEPNIRHIEREYPQNNTSYLECRW